MALDDRAAAAAIRSQAPRLLGTLGLLVAIWGVAVGVMSVRGILGAHPGGVAVAIFVSWGGAVAAFAFAYRRYDQFRLFVLSVDLRVVVAFQFFRFAGLAFFVAYGDRKLPAAAAMVAGVLDLFVCYSALVLVFHLLDRRPFMRRTFLSWNVIGIADFVVTALVVYLVIWHVLSSAVPGWEAYRVVTAFPFAIVSCFMVPIAIVMHLTAILQTRHERWRWMAPLFTAAQPAAEETAERTVP